jgi:hypothetical protein
MSIVRNISWLLLAASLTVATPSSATIDIDLSYVDPQSVQYARFKHWVDQAVAGQPGYSFSATDAAWMYRLTGEAKYARLAVQMVQAQVQAADDAIALGDAPEVAHDSYLYVGDMIGDLAITYDWCGGYVTAQQKQAWAQYAEQAVWNVWHHDDAEWGGKPFHWSGWSTDNPGDNYYYSFVQATMYWALASGSTTWMNLLEIDKIPSLEGYFAKLPGGGSLEGTGYGVSHQRLFELYRVWRDSTGHDAANANSHLTDSIAFGVHATVPTLDQYAPIGDLARESQPNLFDYHRNLMLQARRMTADPAAASLASWWLNAISVSQMMQGFDYRHDLLPAGANTTPPAALTYYAAGTGHLFSRTAWDRNAMWMEFTAGPYVESHAHQDQGEFMLYAGDWLAVTENIWSHSGIRQDSEVTNVLRFEQNGMVVSQAMDTQTALHVDSEAANGEVQAHADLTPAYGGNSAVKSWTRSIDFAGRALTVSDDFTLGAGTLAVFQVNVPVQPVIHGLDAVAGRLHLHVVEPTGATLSAVDWTAQDSDYESGWRIDIRGGTGRYVVRMDDGDDIFADGFDGG